MKDKNYFSFSIIFFLEIFSLLVFINSLSFYVLEQAKEYEKSSSKENMLPFTIKGGVDQGFNEDVFFKIKTEFYNDDKYLSEANAECSIPKNPNAEFGTSIQAYCEINLSTTEKANKIKFIKAISGDNFTFNDLKNYVIENSFTFTSKTIVNKKPDFIFTAAKIKTIKCEEQKFIFEISGEMSKYWIDSFSFDMNINDSNSVSAKCECPNIYFNSDVNINCTITISNSNDFMESLKKGIILKETFYKAIDKNGEKLLKIEIKNNNEKIEFKDFNCNEQKSSQVKEYGNEEKKDNSENKINIVEKGNIFSNRNKEKDEEEKYQSPYEREREEERRRREREEREREQQKKKRDQEELENFLKQRQRQREREENEKRNRYNNYEDNDQNIRIKNYNNNNYNQINNNNDEIIDSNSNVKLIHLQVRYSYGFIYYMFYALTPVPLGHKIKARFTITKYNYDTGYNDIENKYIILKTEEEISPNDKNIVVEYLAKYDCQECKKMVLDKYNIQGANILNFPEETNQLDAISINQNNYLTKSKVENPPLYITENIYNQNCMINLNGNFFNKNKFFASKFALNLIGSSYYGNNRNITVYCGLNERSIFACPINENINNFEYKLESLIIDRKENIIIDNSFLAKIGTVNQVSCQMLNNIKIGTNNNLLETKDKVNEKTKGMALWVKIFIGIIIIIVLYYVISKCFCPKEEEEPEQYNPNWRVSSSNYGGGEAFGLRNRW